MIAFISFFQDFAEAFIDLSVEMSIWLLIGFLFAGLLNGVVNKNIISKYLGKSNSRSIWNAALLGVPLPLCSCGVIPTAVAFHKNGANKSASISFLISTPQTGVDSILATYSLLGLPFAIIRPLIAFVTGIFGGLLTKRVLLADDISEVSIPKDEEQKEAVKKSFSIKKVLRYGFVEFMDDLSKWLLIGLVLAAVISAIIPTDFFEQQLSSPILQMGIILVASIPIYVCATGSIPIAAVLMLKGLSPGAALVFLMAGPATNMATITVIGKSLGTKSLMTYLASIIIGALSFGLIIDYALPAEWFTGSISTMSNHGFHIFPIWLSQGAAILLGLLIVASFIRQSKWFSKKTVNSNTNNSKTNEMSEYKTIKVGGMNCAHCKANVENTLTKLPNIEFVEANIHNEEVFIEGENIDLELVKKEIESIGYKYLEK